MDQEAGYLVISLFILFILELVGIVLLSLYGVISESKVVPYMLLTGVLMIVFVLCMASFTKVEMDEIIKTYQVVQLTNNNERFMIIDSKGKKHVMYFE